MANLYNRQRSKQELLRHVGHMDQLAGIKLLEALDGKARGSRVLEVWTGTGLRFRVLADRALDISACDYQGKSLSWLSPVGDAHPAYYEPPGAGWLRTFQGGFLVTCGLDQFGAPSTDEGVELGLHGRVSTLPARAVNYRTEWVDDEYELEISGEVRQAVLFGENLVLRRTISTRLGSNRIRIADTVVNEGFAPYPHMILYHFNLGFPLVSAASRIHVEVEKSRAWPGPMGQPPAAHRRIPGTGFPARAGGRPGGVCAGRTAQPGPGTGVALALPPGQSALPGGVEDDGRRGLRGGHRAGQL